MIVLLLWAFLYSKIWISELCLQSHQSERNTSEPLRCRRLLFNDRWSQSSRTRPWPIDWLHPAPLLLLFLDYPHPHCPNKSLTKQGKTSDTLVLYEKTLFHISAPALLEVQFMCFRGLQIFGFKGVLPKCIYTWGTTVATWFIIQSIVFDAGKRISQDLINHSLFFCNKDKGGIMQAAVYWATSWLPKRDSLYCQLQKNERNAFLIRAQHEVS